jgi:hypothetical protein
MGWEIRRPKVEGRKKAEIRISKRPARRACVTLACWAVWLFWRNGPSFLAELAFGDGFIASNRKMILLPYIVGQKLSEPGHQSPTFKVPSSKSQVQGPRSKVQSPKSKVQSPKAGAWSEGAWGAGSGRCRDYRRSTESRRRRVPPIRGERILSPAQPTITLTAYADGRTGIQVQEHW